MRRFAIATLALLCLLPGKVVLAQESQAGSSGIIDSKIMPVPPGETPPTPLELLGEDQRYSVTLRGNGEAVVNMRLSLVNSTEAALSRISLRIPKGTLMDVLAFQVIIKGRCVHYGNQGPQAENSSGELMYSKLPPCLAYEEPDFYNWYGPASYQKAKAEVSGDSVDITLPQPVKPTKSGSLVLAYRVPGLGKKDFFGAFHFTFETLKVNDKIQSLQVGISTDSDLVLKGTRGVVNYRFEDSAVALKGMSAETAPVASNRLDSFYQQIGAGQLIKTASDLQPFDSYTVRGSYADSIIRLYGKEIAIGVGVFLLLAILLYGFARLAFRKRRPTDGKEVQPQIQNQSTDIVLMLGVSFFAAVLAVGYTIILVIVMQNLSSVIPEESTMVLSLLLLIISLGVYGFLLVTPAIFMGLRRGLGFGAAAAALTFGWMVLALILFFLFSVLGGNRPIPYLVPMMGSTLEKQAVQNSAPPGVTPNAQ